MYVFVCMYVCMYVYMYVYVCVVCVCVRVECQFVSSSTRWYDWRACVSHCAHD